MTLVALPPSEVSIEKFLHLVYHSNRRSIYHAVKDLL